MRCPVCGKKMFFRTSDVGWTQHYLCSDENCRTYIVETGCKNILDTVNHNFQYVCLTENEYKESLNLYIKESMSENSFNNQVDFIARVRYLGWVCYQMGANLPLHDVSENFEISEERLDSLKKGTAFALMHPFLTAEDNHSLWMRGKAEQGYKYGDKLDVEKKTHPSMVSFNELSDVEKRKDEMDILMVNLAKQLYSRLFE